MNRPPVSAGQITVNAKLPFTVGLEDGVYVAICPLLDIASQGDTEQEAMKNLTEATAVFLFTCHEMGTLKAVVEQCGFTETSDHRAWSAMLPQSGGVYPAEGSATTQPDTIEVEVPISLLMASGNAQNHAC